MLDCKNLPPVVGGSSAAEKMTGPVADIEDAEEDEGAGSGPEPVLPLAE